MATGGWGGGGAGGGAWGGTGGGAWGAKPVSTADLEDGDMEEQQQQQQQQPSRSAYGSAAPPPAYNTAGTFGRSSEVGPSSMSEPLAPSNSTSREAELKRKEAALAAKEKELKSMEQRMAASGVVLEPPKNWPICWPWIYHDIGHDIPEGHPRRVVREGYMTWWGLVACMLWNFFCASAMLGQKVDYKISSWFLAVLYLVLGIPIAFMFWYRPLYNGCKNESTFSMLGFFIMFILHVGFCVWAAVAVPFSNEYWSFAGFVAATRAFDVNAPSGIIFFIGASLWTLEALWSFWVLKDVFFFFKGKGGIEQAKKDVALATISAGVHSSSNAAWGRSGR